MSHSPGDTLTQEQLYERAPCGLMTIDRSGVILTANRTLLSWLEIDRPDDVSRLQDLLRVGDRIYWETHVAPLLAMQGQIAEIAMELVVGERNIPVLINARAVEGSPDTIDLAVFRAHDRRSYEHELLKARKEAERAEAKATELAQTLQSSLIPPSLPNIDGVALGAAYRPAGSGAEVGGDFYDVFQIGSAEWMVVVGDVCGKGPGAAALTAMARYTIRGVATETGDLQRVMTVLNRTLLSEPVTSTLTTVLMKVSLDPSSAPSVTTCAAGHPLPCLVDGDGQVRSLGEPGTLLGAFPTLEITTATLSLEEGVSVVLLTDGVTEARHAEEYYDESRLVRNLSSWAGLAPHEICENLVQDCVEFQGGTAHDDLAVVVVQRR